MSASSEKRGSINRISSPTETELLSYLASQLPSHPPPAYTRRASQLNKPLLPQPICLPQLSSGGRQSDFLWADARELRDSGVGKEEWARFLRGLEVARNGSGTFRALDMTGVGIKLIPLPFIGLAGSALTSLASSSKSALTRSTVDTYLQRANSLLFTPLGLQVQIFTTKGLEQYLKQEHERNGTPEGYAGKGNGKGKGKEREGPTATQKFGRGVGKFAMHVPIVAAFAHPIVRAIADDPSKRSSASGPLSPLASKYQAQTTPFAAHHLNRLEGAIAELELGVDYFPADCGLTEGDKRGDGTWMKMNTWRVQRKREMESNVSGRALKDSSPSSSSSSSDSDLSDTDTPNARSDSLYSRKKMERDLKRAKKRQRRLESQEERRQRRQKRELRQAQRRVGNKDITENWRLDKECLWCVVVSKDEVSDAIARDLYPVTSPTSPTSPPTTNTESSTRPTSSSVPITPNDELPAYPGKAPDGDGMMKDDVRGLFEKRA